MPGQVRMYSCGPTVYSHPHIGNMRTFLWNDLLRRYLEWRGYRVTQIMNITDVVDRIIQNAKAAGQDIYSYTAPYISTFHESLRELRIRPADAYPRATAYIPQMVQLVERLNARGHAYVADGSTYFRTLADRSRRLQRLQPHRRRSLRQGKRPRFRFVEGQERIRAVVADKIRRGPSRMAPRMLRHVHGAPRRIV